jgi:putative selenate reductase
MEKKFHPAPLDLLARWIFAGLDRDEVMGLPRSLVVQPDPRLRTTVLARPLGAPLGVAAGPHTQLAQNIAAAWLFGARFIELKTVQVLDEIAVSRPCIDSADLTFNCEWSQELTLEQSFREYLHAWVLVHALAHKLGIAPDVFFNMSVGYDLKGIQTDKVQRFLRRMRDASQELPAAIDAVATVYPAVRDLDIPAEISTLLTLSTMHGCPPAEIERIARYMLEDLGLHTWVKLNPTLLGPDTLRGILNDQLGHNVIVDDAAFDHDPKFDDAMAMIEHLEKAATDASVSFGIKLSNTLEVRNHRPVFLPHEKSMYMSGRALHPLTLTLAHRVTEALDGRVPISFCGGADAFNFPQLVADGLGPVTTCTDVLRPGGYARLAQYIDTLSAAMLDKRAASLESFIVRMAGADGDATVSACARRNLAEHAKRLAHDASLRARPRPLSTKGQRKLHAFDCIAAPCQEGCPTHQSIPTYMRMVAQGRSDAALQVILQTNAMPAVTGRVCDHPCVARCVRNHYDSPLAIRAIKRHAADTATAPNAQHAPVDDRGVRVAVIGAGPAGLSAAYYLARVGASVVVFEAKPQPGGMVSSVIPAYRLPDQPIVDDVARIRAAGAELRLGTRIGDDVTFSSLLEQGFGYFVLAVGAQVGRKLGIEGEDAPGVIDALTFLNAVRRGEPIEIGPRVLVIGGGNCAMDAARTAARKVGKGAVTIVYRRTKAQMPADHEEVQACVEEGVAMRDLLAPARVVTRNGAVAGLVCTSMRLGDPDDSGRPYPIPIEGSDHEIRCETILVAISQEPSLPFVQELGLKVRREGTVEVDPQTLETNVLNVFAAGDVVRGAATVIKAIADGRRIAETIAVREGLHGRTELVLDERASRSAVLEKRSRRMEAKLPPEAPVAERRDFREVKLPFDPPQAILEASRCLDCDTLCSLCVTVCPNRANQAYRAAMRVVELPRFVVERGVLRVEGTRVHAVGQQVQVLNLADFCNECGNCTTFCPTSGAPFRDKPRVYLDREAFGRAPRDAFWMDPAAHGTRLEAKVGPEHHVLEYNVGQLLYTSPSLVMHFDASSWQFLGAVPLAELKEGTVIDSTICGTMMTLLDAAPVVPR